jgi:hypothetical protein
MSDIVNTFLNDSAHLCVYIMCYELCEYYWYIVLYHTFGFFILHLKKLLTVDLIFAIFYTVLLEKNFDCILLSFDLISLTVAEI